MKSFPVVILKNVKHQVGGRVKCRVLAALFFGALEYCDYCHYCDPV
jgi:hypothetical protein